MIETMTRADLAGFISELSLPPPFGWWTMVGWNASTQSSSFAMDGFQLLDLAGPMDVLRSANTLSKEARYRPLIATSDGVDVRSDSGVRIGADVSLRAIAASDHPVDTLTVVGGFGTFEAVKSPPFLADVAQLSARAGRTTSVCTGSLVLAAAGLLDGYAATTHWGFSDDLAAHEGVALQCEQIFVHDRDRWTSAGVTAGIDLFLALVEEDHGPQLAHRVAAMLVVFVRRPGGQSSSTRATSQPSRVDPVHRRGAALAQRQPCRRPPRRGAGGARTDESTDLRADLPS